MNFYPDFGVNNVTEIQIERSELVDFSLVKLLCFILDNSIFFFALIDQEGLSWQPAPQM